MEKHIYLITCTETKKQYVGQSRTVYTIHGKVKPFGYTKRWVEHVRHSRNASCGSYNSPMSEDIRKYGKEKFELTLLHTCSDEDSNHFEKHYINEYKTLIPNGYNRNPGGGNYIRTEEKNKKTSDSVKALWADPEMKAKYSDAQFSKNDLDKVEKFSAKGITEIEIRSINFTNHNRTGIRCVLRSPGNPPLRMEFCGKSGSFEDFYQRAVNISSKICDNVVINLGNTSKLLETPEDFDTAALW